MSVENKEYCVNNALHAFKQRKCIKLCTAPDHEAPTPDDVKELRRLMGWSQNDVAKMVGAKYNPQKGSTTVRKWCANMESNIYRQIPYPAWRLLLIYAGIAMASEIDEALKGVD